jgi:RND family efflux transporter MFP subunit
LTFLFPVLVAAGCGNSDGQTAEANQGGGQRGGRGGRGDPNAVTPVEVAIASRGPVTRVTALTGSVDPIRRVGVNSQISGALLSINVEEGSIVRKDQVLAQIDARELNMQLASAEAALTAAKSAMDRAEKMRKAQIYTDIEYDRDKTALASAQSTRDQLQTRIGYATVKSPLDGIVIDKLIEAGDIVGSQSRLFTIADVSTLVVRVNVSELEVGGLREGQNVELSLDALPNARVGGRIRRIFPAADSVSRLVPVEVELTGSDARQVRPGFLARATFRSNARENALLIPVSAVVVSVGASVVYVVNEGKATRTSVRPGLTSEGRIEILEGLSEGDTVIVAGNIAVRDGARVRVVTAAGDSLTVRSAGGASGSGRGGGRGPGGAPGRWTPNRAVPYKTSRINIERCRAGRSGGRLEL